MIACLAGRHFPTSDCENEPEPCGDFNKSLRVLTFTTYEKKTGFLLIAVFRKLFNAQNYGHQGSILGGLSYMSGSVRLLHSCQFELGPTMREDK
jgi:hypothetical protein